MKHERKTVDYLKTYLIKKDKEKIIEKEKEKGKEKGKEKINLIVNNIINNKTITNIEWKKFIVTI